MEDAVYQEFLELERTHWWFRGRRAIFVSLLDRHLGRAPDGRRLILDVGCGVGGMLGPLAEYGRVIGTDVTLKGLQHCAARHFPRLVASHGAQGCFQSARRHGGVGVEELEPLLGCDGADAFEMGGGVGPQDVFIAAEWSIAADQGVEGGCAQYSGDGLDAVDALGVALGRQMGERGRMGQEQGAHGLVVAGKIGACYRAA